MLPLSDVRGMRVLYHKLLDRASRWDPGGNAKVLWLGHLHRVQARSSLVQQRAALQLEHVVEHVMQSIAGGENLYIVQIALAILYEACLWRQPDAKLAVVLYTPTHQETMEEAMAKLVDESDCYSTAQQARVRYFRYLKDVMSATCIPSEVNFGRFWCGLLGMVRAWYGRRTAACRKLAGARLARACGEAARSQHKFSRCSAWLVLCGAPRRQAACSGSERAQPGSSSAWPRRLLPPHRSQQIPRVLGLPRACGGFRRHRSQHKFRTCSAPHKLNHAHASFLHRLSLTQPQPRHMHNVCTFQRFMQPAAPGSSRHSKTSPCSGLPRPPARHGRHARALRDRVDAPKHPLRLSRALSRPLHA